jgi:putative transposase
MRNEYPHFQAEPLFNEKLDTIRKEAHTTYNVNYHFVWIPKYRKKILNGRAFKRILEEIIKGQCEARDWQVLAFEIQPDHIHLFVSVPPKFSASYVANILKGNSSIQLRRIFPMQRIQRKRTKGWRMPKNTIYVGRPSKWGNPYTIENVPQIGEAPKIFSVMYAYRQYLQNRIVTDHQFFEELKQLKGKNLACWCKLNEPCHADILLEVLNSL